MERTSAVRKSHCSTGDFLTWPESPPHDSPSYSSTNASRSHQPSDGISKVLSGGQITEEEAESLNRRKPCSGYKLKDITGNKIFAANGDGSTDSQSSDFSLNKTSVKIVQQATNGISQISFSTEGNISPKKPVTLTEVAKQRELCGTIESELESKSKKQLSDAKCKELSGNDIFGPPPEVLPRSVAAGRSLESKGSKEIEVPVARVVRTSVKVSNPAGGQSNIIFSEEPLIKMTRKMHEQKFAELTGNDIFNGGVPNGSSEKALSSAKLKEMSGSDIFTDTKVESRDYLRGFRKPPGGESSIALI